MSNQYPASAPIDAISAALAALPIEEEKQEEFDFFDEDEMGSNFKEDDSYKEMAPLRPFNKDD